MRKFVLSLNTTIGIGMMIIGNTGELLSLFIGGSLVVFTGIWGLSYS